MSVGDDSYATNMSATIRKLQYQRNSDARPGRARGFTLIELMTVVAILVILLGLGVPGMRNIIIKTRVKNASFDVYSNLLAARSDAISRNKTVTMTPNGSNWAAGWTITDSDLNTLKTQDPFPGVTITGPTTLVYLSTGRLNAGSAPQFSLTAPDAAANDGRCINIDLSGRPVVATGVCP
jgi:type IV fimbrial biogenesis protein FimT